MGTGDGCEWEERGAANEKRGRRARSTPPRPSARTPQIVAAPCRLCVSPSPRAVSGSRAQSAAAEGSQRHSRAVSGRQRQSRAVEGYHGQPGVTSAALRGDCPQRHFASPSVVIQCSQSAVISGHPHLPVAMAEGGLRTAISVSSLGSISYLGEGSARGRRQARVGWGLPPSLASSAARTCMQSPRRCTAGTHRQPSPPGTNIARARATSAVIRRQSGGDQFPIRCRAEGIQSPSSADQRAINRHLVPTGGQSVAIRCRLDGNQSSSDGPTVLGKRAPSRRSACRRGAGRRP